MKNLEREARVAEQQANSPWEREKEQLTLHPELDKVFWSRPEGIDKVAHYVIIVNGNKYELRDVSERHDRSQIAYRTARVAFTVHEKCSNTSPKCEDKRQDQ